MTVAQAAVAECLPLLTERASAVNQLLKRFGLPPSPSVSGRLANVYLASRKYGDDFRQSYYRLAEKQGFPVVVDYLNLNISTRELAGLMEAATRPQTPPSQPKSSEPAPKPAVSTAPTAPPPAKAAEKAACNYCGYDGYEGFDTATVAVKQKADWPQWVALVIALAALGLQIYAVTRKK